MKNDMWEEINASHIDSLKLTLEELKNFNNKACQWLCFSVMRQLIMKRCQEFKNDCQKKI